MVRQRAIMAGMRRLGSAAAALVLLVAGCGGGDDGDPSTVGGSDFEVTVPRGWFDAKDVTERKDFRDKVQRFVEVPLGDARFEAVVASREPVDRFAANVNVVKEASGLPDSIEAHHYERESRRVWADLYRRRPSIRPAGVTRPRATTVGGTDAVWTDASRTITGRRRLRQRQTFVIHEGSAFVITYSAVPEDFDDKLARHAELLASWRWK